MKGVAVICLILCIGAYSAETSKSNLSTGLQMIEAAKSAAENFFGSKKSLGSLLDIIKDVPLEEKDKPKPNVIVNLPDGKIELTIDLSHKETSESVDGDYNMVKFRSAIDQIKEQLVPIVQMQLEFNNSNQDKDVDEKEEALEFNRKVIMFASNLYHSQDTIKRDIVILDTNLEHLKDPSFRICDFYFNGSCKDLEYKIYKEQEASLEEARKNYLLERSKLMWNAADAKKFLTMLSNNFDKLFNYHEKLLYYYNTKQNNREELTSIDEQVLDKLKLIFALRIRIAENIQFILREIDAFAEYKDTFQHIFDSSVEKAEDIQIEEEVTTTEVTHDSGINDEEYFKTKEQQTKDDTIQISIEQSLASGKIKMQDITDTSMADRIISNPLLKSATGDNGLDGQLEGNRII